ncbi:MAG: hypothetical protein NZ824_05480 [Candidatus Thioglobus sp.]|nr:hypothetical protein [Candidatus Thioglobus sp.]
MGKIRLKIPGLGSKTPRGSREWSDLKAEAQQAKKEALEQQQITGTTDDILEAEAVTGAPDVVDFQLKPSPKTTKYGGDAMEQQVYPEGKSKLQGLGSAITGTGRRVSNTGDFLKESTARSLGGQDEAQAIVARHAKAGVDDGGLQGAASANSESAASFSHTLKGEIDHIDNNFRGRFRKLGNLTVPGKDNRFIETSINKVINKYRKNKAFATSDEGKAMLGVMDDWIDGLKGGEWNQTEVLRKLRRYTGERSFSAGRGGKDLAEAPIIDRLNADMREVFMEAVSRKGFDRKRVLSTLRAQKKKAYLAGDETKVAKLDEQIEFNKKFLENAIKTDKDYSRYMRLKTKAQPGSGELDAIQILKTLDNPEASSKLLNSMVGDKTHGMVRIKEFRKRIEAIQKVSGREGLAGQVENHLQETLAHKLFNQDVTATGVPNNFASFMSQKSGRDIMKSVWPKQEKMIDQWHYVMQRTSDKDQMGSFLSRMMATFLGGGAGFVIGGPIGAAAGSTGTLFVINGLLKSRPFQNFAIKQFSKEPYKPYKALGKLGDIIEKVGGDRVHAKQILDSMVGGGTIGTTAVVGGTLGYNEYDEYTTKEEFNKMRRERNPEKFRSEEDEDKIRKEFYDTFGY